MPYEMTIGLFVTDPEKYAEYRSATAPLLDASGGRFRYDFEVSRTLESESGQQINRVFVLEFPDRDVKDRYFANPKYVAVRKRLFEPAVQALVKISESGS
jgi:uncharacterized protein (DUF1330 family)